MSRGDGYLEDKEICTKYDGKNYFVCTFAHLPVQFSYDIDIGDERKKVFETVFFFDDS